MHTLTHTWAYTCYLDTVPRLPRHHCFISHAIQPNLREESEPQEYGSSQMVNLSAKKHSRAPPTLMKCCFAKSISHHQFSLSSIYCACTASHPWCEARNCRSRALHSTARPRQSWAGYKLGCLARSALTPNLSLFALLQAGTFKRDYVLKNIEGQRLKWNDDEDLQPSETKSLFVCVCDCVSGESDTASLQF